MSDAGNDNGSTSAPSEGAGVLSNLPRTRPQRSSARRVAAREASTPNGAAPPPGANGSQQTPPASGREKTTAAPRGAKVAAGSVGKQRPRRTSAGSSSRERARRATPPPAPTQGFECDGDRASGPVQPPGSSELIASAVEMLGELAKSGVSSGERLLKDVLARIPGS